MWPRGLVRNQQSVPTSVHCIPHDKTRGGTTMALALNTKNIQRRSSLNAKKTSHHSPCACFARQFQCSHGLKLGLD